MPVGDIVRTVRALETAQDPIADPAGSTLGHEIVRPLWRELHAVTMRRLDRVTLKDLCARTKRPGVEGGPDRASDIAVPTSSSAIVPAKSSVSPDHGYLKRRISNL